MHRYLCLLVLLVLLPLPVTAADGPVTYAEVMDWVHSVLVMMPSPGETRQPPVLTQDGYALDGKDVVLYLDQPEYTGESGILALQLKTDRIPGPRGVQVGTSVTDVLAAFPCLNLSLAGDPWHALVYMHDRLPETAGWGWLSRDHAQVDSVQYAVHERITEGGYSDTGFLFLMEDGHVSGIRVYGLQTLLTLEDVESTCTTVLSMSTDQSYSVPEAPAPV